jgi:hypothetical protein
MPPAPEAVRDKSFRLPCAVVLCTLGLLFYSQTDAFAWDEGFHLLAAWLIRTGKRPYLDIVFAQTPLNAYWNALWMTVAGPSWRVAHVLAALSTGGALWLLADYLRKRVAAPIALTAAFGGVAAFALNVQVVEFGTIAQAYGLCLLLTVAAFRVIVLAVERKGAALACAAGCLSTAAAAASLLAAPVAPIMALWMVWRSRAGSRWTKLAAFCAGGLMATLPVLVPFAQSPDRTIFFILKYHMFHRLVGWPGAIEHDHQVLAAWLYSPQSIALGVAAAAGLAWSFGRGRAEPWRHELHLCAALAVALAIHISAAHPTFERYYVLLVPYLAVLAGAGLCAMRPAPAFLALVVFTFITAANLAWQLADDHDTWTWKDLEGIAAQVASAAPPGAKIYADEQIYFLLGHTPAPGLEWSDTLKFESATAELKKYGIVTSDELTRRVRAREFDVVESCSEKERGRLRFDRLFAHNKEIEDCVVYWGR